MNGSFGGRYSVQLTRWVVAAALLLGVVAGLALPRLAAVAQEADTETFTASAGGSGEFNTAILAFAPQSLQVHRGDTITWLWKGFHNIHFEQGAIDLLVPGELDGQQVMQLNPEIMLPNVENGGVFQGGNANSGLPLDPTTASATFSLVMDAEPGVYTYYCDVHPGMVGTVEVVADDVAIPSPAEVLTAGANEMAASAGQALGAAVAAYLAPDGQTESGGLLVQAGLQAGPAAVLAFFPATAVVEVGQSVTWAIPPGMEPHTITSPPLPPGSEIQVIPQEGGPPMVTFSEAGVASVADGAVVSGGGPFNTGLLFPGQSYTLSFDTPGVYDYVCILHAGMTGSVVVMPAS